MSGIEEQLGNCGFVSADFLRAKIGNETMPIARFYASLSLYRPAHGWVSVLLCSFSLCTNLLNVLVFLRRHMVNSVTFALAAIAICDMVTWFPYIVYAIRFSLMAPKGTHTFGWVCFLELHAILTTIGHCSNMWLSVAVAYMRLNVLKDSASSRPRLMSLNRSKRIVLSVVILVGLSTLPALTAMYPQPMVYQNRTYWAIMPSPYHLKARCLGFLVCMMSIALLHKIAPCVLLAYYVFSLIYFLRTYERKSVRLRGLNPQSRTGDKTTITLICLVSVSLITELPQGAVLFLYGMNPGAALSLYVSAGDVIDLLSIINSSVNFFFYILMNSQYREEAYALLSCTSEITRRRRRYSTSGTLLNSVVARRQTLDQDNMNTTSMLNHSDQE